jgi:hypothetical protein
MVYLLKVFQRPVMHKHYLLLSSLFLMETVPTRVILARRVQTRCSSYEVKNTYEVKPKKYLAWGLHILQVYIFTLVKQAKLTMGAATFRITTLSLMDLIVTLSMNKT